MKKREMSGFLPEEKSQMKWGGLKPHPDWRWASLPPFMFHSPTCRCVCEERVFPTPPPPFPVSHGLLVWATLVQWVLEAELRGTDDFPVAGRSTTCVMCVRGMCLSGSAVTWSGPQLREPFPPPSSSVERAGWTGRCWRFLPANGVHLTGILEHLLCARPVPSSRLWGCSRVPSPAPADLTLLPGDTQ